MAPDILSAHGLTTRRYCVTTFDGFYNTSPADELADVPRPHIVRVLAGEGTPANCPDKTAMPYACACLFKQAPLVGNTFLGAVALGLPVEGKQRSASHVGPSAVLKFDLDGIDESAWRDIEQNLRRAGITFLAYTTHSHGRADKPGIRLRLWVPLDQALAQAEYARAWEAFAAVFLSGVEALDQSSKLIHQQQGIFGTTADRAHLAFCIDHRAGVLSSDKLLALCPEKPKAAKPTTTTPFVASNATAAKLASALEQIDPNDYATWVEVGAALAALNQPLGKAARGLWFRYSERADDAHKARNEVTGTCPDVMFDRLAGSVSMTPDAAAGTLMALAKTTATRAVERAITAGELGEAGASALAFLARYFSRACAELLAQHGLEV
ncbi:MAG: hypothetical protein IPL70_15185 [Uliginosibacterium sp.]|nr:hypothetical protein [Uliginosibacterium sp.]